ncbi:alpha/beta fold hydrolase [Frondihabitans cladoniiphilus]|uniref:Alpha/beta hydrolase n=1 Tax=Frondihabitans cladoniiphilus TaxID=715785 RepID=A0ABP8W1G4_9MICO
MRGTTSNPTDGTEIAYEVGGSGEPLLLVHGSGLSKGTWRGLGYLKDLERDFTVIALDLRGHGRSGKPHEVSSYLPPAFIGDVESVLDAVDLGPVHYVGYSVGARIGLRMAAGTPERLRTLTTIGGSFEAMTDQIGRTFFPTWREALETGGMEGFIKAWGAHRHRRIDAATALAFQQNDPVALRAYFEGLESAPPLGIEGASKITVPTLLLAGTDDPDRYRQSQEAARRMAHGSFFELVGQDHASSLLPVDEVTDLIRTFLESLN